MMWSGKIGAWPFVEENLTHRKSKNRPAGIIIQQNIEKVDRKVYRQFVLEKVIPAI
ncbi:TPA: hypothetical protein N0F65_003636 [Lagenidium giganteum]|uniref:Uncharacterized protein n=1 Tax=Lagenidium giganteum TaxID=4803 RepID=A0AAV2YLP5_9STRA|nr:TPA: hypothetical protein N0F65_003636 [Lagenidium giganteum]